MRKRTPSEIKAYGDGYAEAYKEFSHLLKNHDVDKAMRKMKIFADAVALTVETATDEPQTELVNDSSILVKDLVDDEFNPYDEECMRCKHLKLKCEFIPTYCKFESRDEPQTDCPWK